MPELCFSKKRPKGIHKLLFKWRGKYYTRLWAQARAELASNGIVLWVTINQMTKNPSSILTLQGFWSQLLVISMALGSLLVGSYLGPPQGVFSQCCLVEKSFDKLSLKMLIISRFTFATPSKASPLNFLFYFSSNISKSLKNQILEFLGLSCFFHTQKNTFVFTPNKLQLVWCIIFLLSPSFLHRDSIFELIDKKLLSFFVYAWFKLDSGWLIKAVSWLF